MSKNVFERHEIKYILSPTLYQIIIEEIKKYLYLDQYGFTTIQSLYFDTDDFLLIRNSIERPIYKEKIRIRSYGIISDNDNVFLELKKKYNKVVFKRRIELKENDAFDLILNGCNKSNNQIEKEIKYFCNYYKNLKPKMLLLYDRCAYISDDTDLRVTFDFNSRYRMNNLNLHTDLTGELLLPNGDIIMEIKTTKAFPLWLVKILSNNHIYKNRFSKYGTAYKIEYSKKLEREEKKYA